MRYFRQDPAYRSLHPNVKRTITHAVMRHMNPRDGFFMRQGKFAEELGVSLKTVNRHLLKAEERELFTNHGSMFTSTWKGVNTYRVHPRFSEGVSRPVSGGVLEGVSTRGCTRKLRKEAPAREASAGYEATREEPSRPPAEAAGEGQGLSCDGESAKEPPILEERRASLDQPAAGKCKGCGTEVFPFQGGWCWSCVPLPTSAGNPPASSSQSSVQAESSNGSALVTFRTRTRYRSDRAGILR